MGAQYTGRFAPSPTGPLHAGSLVAALASWLDARAHQGRWLVRIEDVDTPRCVPGVDTVILQQLAACGLLPDEPPLYQSQRSTHYQTALDQLVAAHLAYPCACTRQDIERALAGRGQARPRHGELVYPGTCRNGLQGRAPRAWRLLTGNSEQNMPLALISRAPIAPDLIANNITHWTDRRLGPQQQNVEEAVGDFVLKRADGLWAYQLAVVVDDAAQGITDVVRGEDLADNTARQILLQGALGLPLPRYMHTPLVLGANGEKLSKQNGATALDTSQPLQALEQAGQVLRLPAGLPARTPADWLQQAVPLWAGRLKLAGD
ncbi:tRNA glutamyl-Q(34) synthetase GluQRS [Polaromonas sp. A23]|uniref:tRNA glutamyl-Q(34) synthetase GluQRS n=1 Tax=Polaromonas sp. A23 TaxID=1944133 RepID=UPI000985A91A|nr:tRNA glutamyl-Q(34) synthetase GluQRS [Polaromonas sp. A23]OOG36987.1 tRNA glutamyl-Q(34) synthetase GluQRS [Polaromonas sp. A23]